MPRNRPLSASTDSHLRRSIRTSCSHHCQNHTAVVPPGFSRRYPETSLEYSEFLYVWGNHCPAPTRHCMMTPNLPGALFCTIAGNRAPAYRKSQSCSIYLQGICPNNSAQFLIHPWSTATQHILAPLHMSAGSTQQPNQNAYSACILPPLKHPPDSAAPALASITDKVSHYHQHTQGKARCC